MMVFDLSWRGDRDRACAQLRIREAVRTEPPAFPKSAYCTSIGGRCRALLVRRGSRTWGPGPASRSLHAAKGQYKTVFVKTVASLALFCHVALGQEQSQFSEPDGGGP